MASTKEKEKTDSKENHGEDLNTILSTEEQIELTLLIANTTEVMRKRISDTFDASPTSDTKKAHPTLDIKDKNPNIDENEKHEETDEEEKVRKLRESREKELSAPKIQELKKDAEEFFHAWRESVVVRLGEVVNQPKKEIEKKVENATTETTDDKGRPEGSKILREYFLLFFVALTKSKLISFSPSHLYFSSDSFTALPIKSKHTISKTKEMCNIINV